MNESYIPLQGCKTGDVFSRDISDGSGQILVKRNTAANDFIFGKLSECGIRNVHIRLDGDATVKRGILGRLASGHPLRHEEFFQAYPQVFDDRTETVILTECLENLKQADEYTYTHSVNVGFYTLLAAKWLGLPSEELFGAVQAGLLHDIGKTLVDRSVLNKTERLS